jgi:murein DD-endopeptidase MepM/ murein hydrolase activator NlpD
MTEQEMQAVFEKLQRGVELTSEEMIALARNAGYMSGQFKRLDVATDNLAKNFKKATDEFPAQLAKAAGNTAKETAKFAKGLADANEGFRQLNPIIDAVASALSGFPVLSGVAKATAEASKFMIDQLQNATEAFNTISKVGGLTATGMSGLQQQFLRSGMSLKGYTKAITDNSSALANFAGNVGAGAEKFSQVADASKDFREGLMRLGFQIDELGEFQASYIARQTQLGLAQGKSTSQLAVGAAEYAKELDLLSKLTGNNRKEIEKQQNAALSESRFRAQYDEMVASGQEKQAKAMLDFQSIVNNVAPELAQGLRDVSTGFTNSDAAIKLFNTTNGKGQEIMARLQSGQIDQVQAFQELQGAVKGNIETTRNQAKMTGDNPAFTKYAESSKLLNAQVDSMGNLIKQQNEQTSAQGDQLTNNTVTAQKAMQETGRMMNELGFNFMPAATKAVAGFTTALNSVVSMVNKTMGTNVSTRTSSSAAAPGGGRSGPAQRAAAKQAAVDKRIAEAEDAVLSGSPGAGTGNLGTGPVFGAPDTTRADKVQLTLDEIRDEIKKLVAVGGVPGGAASGSGQAQVQAALTEHDHAHPHPPSADVSPELAAKIGTLVAPLEKMNQTSGFIRNDGKTMHGAVDLAGKIGDKVMAPISGVAKVLSDPKGYGNYVEVTDTITGVKHILAHLDKTMVKTGDVIKAGTQIGTVGNTGMSTGAHLHHEIKLPDGTRVDPSKFYAGAAGRGRAPGAPAMAGAPGDLGSLSQKYESGAAGSMAVGRDRSGGTSYGKYQIASKVGSMDAFLKLLQKNDPEAHARLMAAGPQDAGTEGKFAQEWKKLAGEGKIQKSEREFAVDKIFQPAMKGIKDQDLSKMIGGNKGLQEMMFSMAIQHGGAGAPAILNKVFKKGMTPQQLTEASYAERGADGGQRYFGKSSEGERAGVVSRFGREKQDVLAMLGMPGAAPGVPGAPTATALATPQAPAVAPAYTAANAGLAGQGQNVISTGLSAITTALFGGGAQGAPGTAESGVGGSEAVSLLQQLVILSRDQNSNLSKILSASTA